MAEESEGKAREAVGKVTDDERLQSDGKMDQVKGNLRAAQENVKYAVSD